MAKNWYIWVNCNKIGYRNQYLIESTLTVPYWYQLLQINPYKQCKRLKDVSNNFRILYPLLITFSEINENLKQPEVQVVTNCLIQLKQSKGTRTQTQKIANRSLSEPKANSEERQLLWFLPIEFHQLSFLWVRLRLTQICTSQKMMNAPVGAFLQALAPGLSSTTKLMIAWFTSLRGLYHMWS